MTVRCYIGGPLEGVGHGLDVHWLEDRNRDAGYRLDHVTHTYQVWVFEPRPPTVTLDEIGLAAIKYNELANNDDWSVNGIEAHNEALDNLDELIKRHREQAS